jgi:serine/threonine protein kinase
LLQEELALRSEINTLAALAELQHENIVLTYGIQFGAPPDTAKQSFMLLLELCSYDLGNLVHDKKHPDEATAAGQSWTQVCLQISQQMCAGLAFIQGSKVQKLFPRNLDGSPRKVCHLDLKPGNVLIKVRKTPLFEPFMYKPDLFTKTGLGQT